MARTEEIWGGQTALTESAIEVHGIASKRRTQTENSRHTYMYITCTTLELDAKVLQLVKRSD